MEHLDQMMINKRELEYEYKYIIQLYKLHPSLNFDMISEQNRYRLCRENKKIYQALYARTKKARAKKELEKQIKIYNSEQ